MKNQEKRIMKGFTLIEMIIAMGVLTIMAAALAEVFSSGFSTYRETRALQRNVETAQYAMNTMAKLLRTSTVISSSHTDIVFYDYSSSRCFQYQLSGNSLQARWYFTAVTPPVCDSFATAFADVTTGYIGGDFVATESDPNSTPKLLGRVTLVLSVKTDAAALKKIRLQTTVSLRDYVNVGF